MSERSRPRVSIILPTLNEAAVIEDTLRALPRRPEVEILLSDGGSRDDTVERARPFVDRTLIVTGGRAAQLNAAAGASEGEILLFLHADTRLPSGAPEAIEQALAHPKTAGGAFRLEIDSPRRLLRMIARFANLRTRITRIPYGDQGVFVRREVFEALGGFRPLLLMEDLEFGRRMKHAGRVALLDLPVLTSPRRWEKEGALYTTLRNILFVILYYAGVSPHRLVRWYRPVRS
jgi:rSAM/selenodomain-associated transferase 2